VVVKRGETTQKNISPKRVGNELLCRERCVVVVLYYETGSQMWVVVVVVVVIVVVVVVAVVVTVLILLFPSKFGPSLGD